MTITTTAVTIAYAGDGASVAFAVPWPFFGPDEISVYSIVGTVYTLLTRGFHYNVSGGNDAPGTITATAAPGVGTNWLIRRRTARTQQVDFVDFDPFPASTHEQALDRLTAQSQENDESIGRAVRAQIGEPALNALPVAAVRADLFLGFDATGQPVALSPEFAGPVSTAMVPVVGATSTDAALAALYFLDPAAGAALRSIKAKWIDSALSFLDFAGADNTDVGYNDTAWVAFNLAVMATGRPGTVPAGTYKFQHAATMDWGIAGLAAAETGGLIRGVAGRTIFDFTGVTTGPVFLHTCTATGQAAFYGRFLDITIKGNVAGPLVRTGRAGNTDAFNEFVFRCTVQNASTSTSAIGMELNGLYNCMCFIVANCGGHGEALRINTLSFSYVFGSFGNSDTGMRLTGGFSFGNFFPTPDLEVVNLCVQIDINTAVNNTWIGGQWVWTVGSGPPVAMVDFTAGNNNRIIGPNISSAGTIALHSVGLILSGPSALGTEQFGAILLSPVSGDGSLTVDSVVANSADIFFKRAGLTRWQMWRNNGTETGGNAASDLLFSRYTDAGAFIDTPMFLERASGQTHITNAAIGNGGSIGFYGASPIAKPTVTGSRGGNTAVAGILNQLATLGLITDGTSA